ncbi:hypothetical protein [Natronosalvus hydrolyticus]|uniref:hypothetical protein n=1 Tax=Natronosalvus hydrolyticus TaxID=2979988 RepID=UPI00319DAF71
MADAATAVLDRIVDGKTVVLLLGDDGETVDQLDVPLAELPSSARVEGDRYAGEDSRWRTPLGRARPRGNRAASGNGTRKVRPILETLVGS